MFSSIARIALVLLLSGSSKEVGFYWHCLKDDELQ
jgi:hypothetical protein